MEVDLGFPAEVDDDVTASDQIELSADHRLRKQVVLS